MQYFSIWDLVSDGTIELLKQGTWNDNIRECKN